MDIYSFFHFMSSRHSLGTCMADTGLGILDPDKSSTEPCLGRSKGTSVSKEMITAQVPPQGQRHRAEDLGLFQ